MTSKLVCALYEHRRSLWNSQNCQNAKTMGHVCPIIFEIFNIWWYECVGLAFLFPMIPRSLEMDKFFSMLGLFQSLLLAVDLNYSYVIPKSKWPQNLCVHYMRIEDHCGKVKIFRMSKLWDTCVPSFLRFLIFDDMSVLVLLSSFQWCLNLWKWTSFSLC